MLAHVDEFPGATCKQNVSTMREGSATDDERAVSVPVYASSTVAGATAYSPRDTLGSNLKKRRYRSPLIGDGERWVLEMGWDVEAGW